MNTIDINFQRIQLLAYRLWQERGSPVGSPDEDWLHAEKMLGIDKNMRSLPIYALGIERRTS